jgi:hypothetical protein
MSILYLIGPIEDSHWRMDIDHFLISLKASWPNVCFRFETAGNTTSMFYWEQGSPEEGDEIHGVMFEDRQRVSLESFGNEIQNCARFALWYRWLVPFEQRLVLFDRVWYRRVELTSTTTEEYLVAQMGR